jgi:hypothetical protein
MSQQDSLCPKCGLLSWSGHRCAASLEGEEHMSRKAMKLALEALEKQHNWMVANGGTFAVLSLKAISALRRALEKPKYRRGDRLLCLETEEYCIIHISGTDRQYVKFPDGHVGQYTNQQVADHFELLPKKADEWVGLTDEEVEDIYFDKFSMSELVGFARSIEQALKDKNGGEYRNKATTERTKLNQENT